MTSILRLGSKDRSSFLFRRQNSDDVVPISQKALTLPDISQIDSQSFSDLLHHFQNYTAAEDRPQASSASPIDTASPPTTTAQSAFDSRNPGESHPSAKQRLHLDIARNDSTGSSRYSQTSHRDSDFSPLVTRKSSSSSYMQEPVSAVSRTPVDYIPTKKPGKSSSVQVIKAPSKTNLPRLKTEPTTRSLAHLPLNLDKPLPPGPGGKKKASTSVPDLLLQTDSAGSSARPRPSPRISSTPILDRRLSLHPERTVSVRRASNGQVVSELPAWTPKGIRDEQRAKRLSQGHRRKRSASETAVRPDISKVADGNMRQRARISMAPSKLSPQGRGVRILLPKNHGHISATTAENVICKVMSNLDSLDDLKSAALVSKGFFRTFQRNEARLVDRILFRQSPAAWEFRHSWLALQPTGKFLLKTFSRHKSTLTSLMHYFLAHCYSLCKDSTIAGLANQDRTRQDELETALWRIWSFCLLFGQIPDRTTALQAQIDWLNGTKALSNKQVSAEHGTGNGNGLKSRELEDVSEMWQCLQTLVAGFHARLLEARNVGVFDNWQLIHNTTEDEHLMEWTYYLLCLGPETVLSVANCSFEQAKTLGLTAHWPLLPPGQNRSSFLTNAISQVYQDRVLEEAKIKAARFSMQRMPIHRPSRSVDESHQHLPLMSGSHVSHAQSLRLDTSTTKKRRPVSTMVVPEAKFEIRPDCDPLNVPERNSNMFPTSPTADPTVFYGLGTTPTVSAKLGATLFPIQYIAPGPKVPFQQPERLAAARSEVVDPVDKAMSLLVKDLGFEETKARKALAMCDSGSGIDLQKAVELLTIDAKDVNHMQQSAVELPTPQDLLSPNRARRQPKAYCDGHCRSGSDTTTHNRNHSTGTASVASVSPISAQDEIKWERMAHLTPVTAETSVSRTKTVSLKAWRALTKGDSLPKRKNSILHIEEYHAKVERKKSLRLANGTQNQKIKEGLGRNLLGLGLGIGSTTVANTVENQLDQARSRERLKKERPGTFYRPKNTTSTPPSGSFD